jgi:hypothetical protein
MEDVDLQRDVIYRNDLTLIKNVLLDVLGPNNKSGKEKERKKDFFMQHDY